MSLCYERYNKKDAEKVVISGNYTEIGRKAFARHHEIKEVVIPDSVEIIDDYAFVECISLCRIKLPKNLKSIGEYTFAACEKLEYISLPESLFQIRNSAFSCCLFLKKISLYDNINIGNGAFELCHSIEEITLKGRNTQVIFRCPPKIDNISFALLVFNFISADENEKYNMIGKMYFSVYKIPFIIFYALNYENNKSLSYLKRNIHDIVKYLIDTDDSENLTNILKYIRKD
ncbi:MAG: leucine-rich repeat domain-containing protein, partial [Ruminococcus sp.]|nr:leucine-rich repeat domain-containing protein [Ruminococcus sp.]